MASPTDRDRSGRDQEVSPRGEEPERLRARGELLGGYIRSAKGYEAAARRKPALDSLAALLAEVERLARENEELDTANRRNVAAHMAASKEVGRLAGERDEAIAEMNRYDTALAVLEASTEKIGDPFVEEYRWKTGAYHKILGFRHKILAQAAVFARTEAERERLAGRVAALTEALAPFADSRDALVVAPEAWLVRARAALADVGGSE